MPESVKTRTEPVLAFSEVVLPSVDGNEIICRDCSFELLPGAWVRIDTGENPEALPAFAHAAQGLLRPLRGSVAFLGRKWCALSDTEACELRARTRRIFTGAAFLSNLDVDENVTLLARYHFGKRHEEVLKEADALAERCGLSEVPRIRPAHGKASQLLLSQWVRAFLEPAELFVLEEPLRGLSQETARSVCGMLTERLSRGAAALWISGSEREKRLVGGLCTAAFSLQGQKLSEARRTNHGQAV